MPLVHISAARIKKGKLENYKEFYKEYLEIITEKEPQLITFHDFLNYDETEVLSIKINPDAASMDST